MPTSTGASAVPLATRSGTLPSAAPAVIGSASRKLKRAAASRRWPSRSAMLIVAPERDVPGTIARACANPIRSASRSEIASPSAALPAASIGVPEHGAHERHHQRHERGRAEHGLRPVVEQQARGHARQRGDREVEQEARIGVGERPAREEPAQPALEEPQPVAPEGEGHRRERAEVQRHVEGEAAVRPAQQVGEHDQVPRAADREELARALQQPEHGCAQRRHARPPRAPGCAASR